VVDQIPADFLRGFEHDVERRGTASDHVVKNL
jgi:hypothetical protein